MKTLLLAFFSTMLLMAQKPYLVMVADPECPVCIETIKMIGEDKKLKKTINGYTDLQIVTRKKAIAAGLSVTTTPTFYFFAKEKKALLVPPLEGKPNDAAEFAEYIKEVYEKYNQTIVKKGVKNEVY